MRRSFVLAALVSACAVVTPLSLGAATSLPSCTTAQLVPSIAEIAVDQGLPQGGTSYARLARGKQTLVRAYLTTPSSCALTRSEKIEPVSASLTVDNGTSGSTYSNVDPLAGSLASAQQIASPADPYFNIPATALTPANGGAAFNATFTVTVTYKSTNGTTIVNGTTTASAANAVKSVPVDKATNAIRVLVIPIGDPSATTTQFSSAANSAVLQQLTAASRAFPVPTGIDDLARSNGGIRYRINGGLLDAKSLGLFTGGKFCSNATNYAASLVTSGAFAGLTLKGQLLQALSDYNSVNTAAPADVVLGAVDENVSYASSTGTLCPAAPGFTAGGPDDGRASTPTSGALGKPAWARITYTGGPSPVVMELAHNFGISRCCSSFHSPNQQSDASAPNHAMNVLQFKVLYSGGTLGEDHSAMNYNTTSPAAIPYTPDNVVFEPNDWADLLCDLGGVASQTGSCALSATAGTSTGVAANSFDINGTTDGSNLRVTNSYATSLEQGLQTNEDPSSTTRLVLSSGTSCSSPGSTLLNFGLPVQRDEGHSDAAADNTEPLGNPSSFHALVPLTTTPTTVQVLVNGVQKYCRSPQGTPDVTSTTVQPADMGVLLRSFAMPGGGSNGRGIAYDDRSNTLYGTFADFPTVNTNLVEFSTTGTLVRTADIGHTLGSLSYDSANNQLYGGNLHSATPSDNDGNVYTISTGATPAASLKFKFIPTSAGDPAPCRGGNVGAIDGLEYLGSSFAMSGDAAKVAYIVPAAGPPPTSSFTVAAAGSDCNSGITGDGGSGLWLALLGETGTTTTLVHRKADGTFDQSFQIANYEAEDIAYDDETFAPRCAVWTNEATGGAPQIRAYSVPCGGGGPSSQKAVTFTATGDDLVGTAYVTCGDNSPKYPVADSLSPAATEEQVSTFTFAFSPTLSCDSGTPSLITTVSDGIHQSSLGDPNAKTTIESPPKDPVASINAPINNERFIAGAKVPLNGSGFDYTDGPLPASQLFWSVDGNPLSGTPTEITATAGDHTISLYAKNQAGRSSPTVSVTIHVDGTPPVLTLTPGSAGVENVSASDDVLLANVFCSANAVPASLTPSFAPGSTYVGSFSYSTATIQQLSCTAFDAAGNQTTVNTVSQYQPAGQSCGGYPGKTVLQPVNPDGSSVFKKGSAVPVKFTVCDGTGPIGPSAVVDAARATPPTIPAGYDGSGSPCIQPTSPPPPGAPVLCQVFTGAGAIDESVYSNTPDSAFRYSAPQWVFNLSTNNLASGKKYVYYIPLNDDTNIFFEFGLK